jgi:hypothetical protein
MMGINISDRGERFTDLILAGVKTVETRASRSLDSVIGKRVGIVRTGRGTATLVATATVGSPVRYGSPAEFRAAYQHHRVAEGSRFDCTSAGKWGYPLVAVEPVEPRTVTSRGIVLRRID